jgi:hypothetical protein
MATTPVHPTEADIMNIRAAYNLAPLNKLWKSVIMQLSVMCESTDDETVADLLDVINTSLKPGASHHRWGDYLAIFCKLLDTDIERVSKEKPRSLDEAWMAEQEIDALETLKESAMAWSKVYSARYPLRIS